MDVTTALRPAQRFFTATVVAAVTAACLVSSAAGPAGHLHAKKEYGPAKKEYSLSAKKEYRDTPGKKEYTLSAKKEYKVTPDKKEYTLSAKKEYKLLPDKAESSATA